MYGDTDGAYYKNSNDMIVELLTKILGAIAGKPLGGALAQLGAPLLQAFTGPGIWDSFGSTNMTGEGVFSQSMQNRLNAVASQVSSSYGTAYMRDAMRDVTRTFVSYDTWSGRPENKGSSTDAYNAYIDSQVQYVSSIPFATNIFGIVSRMAGMGDPTATGRNLGEAVKNLSRGGMLRGDRNAMMFGSQLVTDLFGDRFDAGQWSGMSSEGVSGVAAAISKDVDFLRDINPTNSDQLSTAVQRFKDTVHMYTEALAPLKDVFGNDIGNMTSILEGLTGQALGQMSVSRLRGLSSSVAARANAGSYDIRDVGAMSQLVRGTISGMPGMGTYVYTSTAEQSITALDMYKTGIKPDFLTDSQWRDAAVGLTTQTAGAGGAELFAQTYALWAKNEKKTNQQVLALQAQRSAALAGASTQAAKSAIYTQYSNMISDVVSFDAFEVMVDKEARGGDRRMAAMRLAGVGTAAEASAGWGEAEYRQAIESGTAARMSRKSMLEWRVMEGASLAGLNVGFMGALGLGRDDYRQAQKWFRNVIDMAAYSPEMLKLTDAERTERLRDTEKYSEEDIGRYNKAISFMKRNNTDLLAQVMLQGNEDQQVESAARAERRRERLRGLENLLFNDEGNLKKLLEGGWSDQRLKNMLLASTTIGQAGLEDGDLFALTSAAGRQASLLYDQDAKAYGLRNQRFINYSMSAEGLASRGFNTEMQRYAEELALGDKADISKLEQSALVMSAYMDVNADAIERFLGSGKSKEEQRKKLAGYMIQARASNNTMSLRAAMQKDMLETKMGEFTSHEAALVTSFREAYKEEGKAEFGSEGWNKDWEGFYKSRAAALRNAGVGGSDELAVLNKLNAAMESAASGISNKPQGADMLEKLLAVLTKLDDTLTNRDADSGNVLNEWTRTASAVENQRGR